MVRQFDSKGFISRIGQRLVGQFDDARMATTPSLIGDAMEKPVKDQLEQILPRGIAVGSGCVIDTYGGTSRQQDIVLYERDICPVFSINDTPDTTYYPCEGVIAIGEVKSILDSQTLSDAFKKVESVKRLKRRYTVHPVPLPDTGQLIPLRRKYGSLHSDSILVGDERSEHDHRNQIFGFVLGGKIGVQVETLCSTHLRLTNQTGDVLSPNLVASLTGEELVWVSNKAPRQVQSQRDGKYILEEYRDAWGLSASAQDASHLAVRNDEGMFGRLVNRIHHIYAVGDTSAANVFGYYFQQGGATALNKVYEKL